MPWTEVNKVNLRYELIYRYLKKERITDLCKEYQISRKTAYKFIHRFEQEGRRGLGDHSRRPHHFAHQTEELVEQLILDLKFQYPTWGAKKIKPRLEELYPQIRIPAVSTISLILARHGLVHSSPRRLRRSSHPAHLTMSAAPNDIWCVDFKGQFQTRDKKYCYPLTISDHYSRYLLACEALPAPSQQETFPVFAATFARHGLPRIIRSDNGGPFASATALYGLTQLVVWFLKLGIQLERIDPGHPEQNGRHERMHRTLKAEACRTIAANLLGQQELFDEFRQIYNDIRPHEALQYATPARCYQQSERRYPGSEVEETYPNHTLTKRVDSSGFITLAKGKPVKISKVLRGERIGLKEGDDSWLVSFCQYDIGIINKETLQFESMEDLDG